MRVNIQLLRRKQRKIQKASCSFQERMGNPTNFLNLKHTNMRTNILPFPRKPTFAMGIRLRMPMG